MYDGRQPVRMVGHRCQGGSGLYPDMGVRVVVWPTSYLRRHVAAQLPPRTGYRLPEIQIAESLEHDSGLGVTTG